MLATSPLPPSLQTFFCYFVYDVKNNSLGIALWAQTYLQSGKVSLCPDTRS